MEKMIFSRKKSTFLLGGWDGGRFGEEVGKLRGGRGEAPLHFLAESFGGGRQRRHFQGNRIKKRGRITTLELPGSWHTCIFKHRCSCMSIAL